MVDFCSCSKMNQLHFVCPSHISPLFVSQELLVRIWSLRIVKTQLLVGWLSVCDFCWRACIGTTWERQTESLWAREGKKKERVWLREREWMGRAGVWLSREEIFSAVCSLSIHGGLLFICCLCGQSRDRQREMVVWGKRRQAEWPGTTWKWGRKESKKTEKEWENKIKTSKEERVYIPLIFVWQRLVYWCVKYITRETTDCLKARPNNF